MKGAEPRPGLGSERRERPSIVTPVRIQVPGLCCRYAGKSEARSLRRNQIMKI